MYILFRINCFHRPTWHSSATLTEIFPRFSSLVWQMPGYNLQRLRTTWTHTKLIVLFFVLFVYKWLQYYSHLVSTELQLTNIYTSIYNYLQQILMMFGK